MHRTISVLTRKVDNLTQTLRSCREHYYKELFSLRHGRQPMEEHEKFWWAPQESLSKSFMASGSRLKPTKTRRGTKSRAM